MQFLPESAAATLPTGVTPVPAAQAAAAAAAAAAASCHFAVLQAEWQNLATCLLQRHVHPRCLVGSVDGWRWAGWEIGAGLARGHWELGGGLGGTSGRRSWCCPRFGHPAWIRHESRTCVYANVCKCVCTALFSTLLSHAGCDEAQILTEFE